MILSVIYVSIPQGLILWVWNKHSTQASIRVRETMKVDKKSLLTETIEHIDITQLPWRDFVNALAKMSFQARNLANAADIYCRMLNDPDCSIILCLSGSLVSAGLKKVVIDLISHNMVDAIVATGANIVDQDFFEALGFKHYRGQATLDDVVLQKMAIDRIYDTLIDEDDLRVCDQTICDIANRLGSGIYSSREFIIAMGQYLAHTTKTDSIVSSAYGQQLPIFVPAFNDCSAGFGLLMQQTQSPHQHVSIDSIKDFRELTRLKTLPPLINII